MNLKNQTMSGVKWLTGSSLTQKVILFCATIILARLLGPKEFGLYALAFVAIDAFGLFKSLGFDTALIRGKSDFNKSANTAFMIIPFLGIFIYIILAFSAPLIGRYLNNAEIVNVVKVLGLIFIISCFGRVPAALLEKKMQFKKITVIDITGVTVYSLLAISLALAKFGIWSLVIAFIIRVLVQNIMAWIFSKWTPKIEFDLKIAIEMFHFGKFIFLGALVWFLRMNLDNILVGKLLGVKALGLYAIAFNIANMTSDYFGSKVQRVVFPAYSKLGGNLYDLRLASLKVLKYVSLIALPFGVGIFLLSEDFLRIFYGLQWVEASSVLKILVLAGIFNTLPTGMNAIFLACDKTKWGFWITFLQVAIFLLFITPAAKLFGMNGVGAIVSIASIISFFATLFLANRLLSLKISQFYLSIRSALIISLWVGIGLFLTKKLLLLNMGSQHFRLNFAILSLLAVIIYVISMYRIERKIFDEARGEIFNLKT